MKKIAKAGNFIIITASLIAFLSSCIRDKLEEEEQKKINEYLAENPQLDFQLKPSGLYYLDVVVGTGLQAQTHDTAYVLYDMKLLDGTVFESNIGTTDTLVYAVNEGKLAVAGFDEGVTYMKVGGQSLLLVPSDLAFGEVGVSTPKASIGGYTPLLFDIYLVRLKKYKSK